MRRDDGRPYLYFMGPRGGRTKKDARSTMKHRGSYWAVLAAGVLFVAGCGSKSGLDMVPIRGEVTYKGKPLTDGSVVYMPVEATGRQATGKIQPDGTFQLTTRQANDGAVKGQYKIVVYATKTPSEELPSREETETAKRRGPTQPTYAIPEKYTNPETSGLTDAVDEKHSGFKKIELTD
jgi:hypothetical protein